ncbi:MAG: flap endonuclease-1 [Methanosarcinaceae archaeon]|nr:flap endonuclease-1 [Methanosarcinaceae archaeon]
MGVDIGSLLIKEEVDTNKLKGKIVAFDAYNIIYQFVTAVRVRGGNPLTDSNGNITSHLSGLLYRSGYFGDLGIKPVFVFDGKPPELKQETIDMRRKAREDAHEKWLLAVEKKDIKAAEKYAAASARVDMKIIEESKELIQLMGFPIIDAPSEGEAQAAFMQKKGDVDIVASQDYDAFLFGAQNVVRNLTVSGKRKVQGKNEYRDIMPEWVNLKKTLDFHNINEEQLIDIGLSVGTDFNSGIPGIGPKRALKFVKERKNVFDILDEVGKKAIKENKVSEEEIEEEREIIKKARQFFIHPPVTEVYELKWEKPKKDEMIELLCRKRDFSEKRVILACEKINKIFEKKQPTLDQWF